MKLYRPSNGTEGLIFEESFCEKCKKDDFENNIMCPIIAKTMVYETTDKEYPIEWVMDDDGKNQRCTAFVDNSEPEPLIVLEDNETLKLFEDVF